MIGGVYDQVKNAIKHQDGRIDTLMALNPRDRMKDLEDNAYKLTRKVEEIGSWCLKEVDKKRADEEETTKGIHGIKGELQLLAVKLKRFEEDLATKNEETRSAVETLAEIEANVAKVSEINFHGIRDELNIVKSDVLNLEVQIGNDPATKTTGMAQQNLFEKVNGLKAEIEKMGLDVIDVKARCHCQHVTDLMVDAERFKDLAQAGKLGGVGTPSQVPPAGSIKTQSGCNHCPHVENLLKRVLELEAQALKYRIQGCGNPPGMGGTTTDKAYTWDCSGHC